MSNLDALVYGMTPAQVYLEAERGQLPEKDLMIGHLVLQAFDDFDRQRSGAEVTKIAGFEIKHTDRLPATINNTYGERPVGLVELALKCSFPDHHYLMTNTSVDHAGYVAVRGIHANDALYHPYVVACMGLVENGADIRMNARLQALDIAGLPRPSEATARYMMKTMRHNRPSLQATFEHHSEWLNSNFRSTDMPYVTSPLEIARIGFCADGEVGANDNPHMWVQARFRFVRRHPGCEAIFAPFPQKEPTLACIRHLAQTTRNMNEVDGLIARSISEELWEHFQRDPRKFCEDLQGPRLSGNELEEDDQPSP